MMDSRDVSNNNHVFSSSSLAASNYIHDGLPLLLISVHDRGTLHDETDDVNNRPQASPFLSSDQNRLQDHSIQSAYNYYNNNPAPEDNGASSLDSVTIVETWSEVAFPVIVLTVSLIGIVAVGILLFYWYKRNLSQQQSKKKYIERSVYSATVTESVSRGKMSEHDGSPTEVAFPAALSSVSSGEGHDTSTLEPLEAVEGSSKCNPDGQLPLDTICKNITSDSLPMVSSPHNLRRSQAKYSLNNLSLLSATCSPLSSPSPPMKSIGRKFSFNQSHFYEQQQQVSSSKTKNSANNNGGNAENRHYPGKIGSKSDCLISKVSVLRGDICCVQPPPYHTPSGFESTGTSSPIPSSPKPLFDQPTAMVDELFSPLSDDKENLVKCVSPHEGLRNQKTLRGYHHGSNAEGSDSRKVLTQSPIFFSNDQNSPSVHDSLTPSSVSSATSTATNTTPNTLINSSSSSTKGRFTFSPKVVNEYDNNQDITPPNIFSASSSHGRHGNSYFRFPEVDTFTPPSSAQATANVYKIPSLVTSCIPTLETPSKEEPAQSLIGSSLDRQDDNIMSVQSRLLSADADGGEIESQHIDELCVNPPVPFQDNVSTALINRASRRARLKSISLDSEGARLVEENLSTSIPVEELVEIAAGQAHYSSVAENPLQSFNQSQTMGDIGENSFASCKKRRNIFNLTLNLNDKDETLMVDDDYKFNEFYFEYYDYDDEEDEEYDMELNAGAGTAERHHRKQHSSQLPTPRTPTLTQTRKKASSLDSDQSLTYLLPAPARNHCPMVDKGDNHHASGRCTLASSSSISSTSLRTSSLSVPTTPKRQPYRLQQHHAQQQHGKYKQSRQCVNDSFTSINNSPASERFSCMTQQKDSNLSVSNVNLKTLPEITSVCDFADKDHVSVAVEKPPIQTLNKSRSSILQRRGSNHSLTLNLDAPPLTNIGLSKGLSASNYSLGNYKGSHLSLVGSSNNLQHQQQRQSSHQASSTVQTVQTKKNLLQRRGSNTSLVLNLQGSSSSLNRYTSHSSLNIQNQQNVRPVKRGLLERRNSNTSLTLINIQNRALSVSNCNLPGSNCSLNSMATYQTQNDGLMLEEDEHQLTVNSKQPSCCSRPGAGTTSESHHLSPSCQQHGARRKFLSSDSLHNIASSRAGCCCQQKETNSMDNPQIGYNRSQMSNHSGEYFIEFTSRGPGGKMDNAQWGKGPKWNSTVYKPYFC